MLLFRAMASSAAKEQFLRQMEQIVEGIKQNRIKVELSEGSFGPVQLGFHLVFLMFFYFYDCDKNGLTKVNADIKEHDVAALWFRTSREPLLAHKHTSCGSTSCDACFLCSSRWRRRSRKTK